MEQLEDGASADVSTTTCGHAFHTSCLVPYALYYSHQSSVLCPLCRESIGEQTDIMLQRQVDTWVGEIRRRSLFPIHDAEAVRNYRSHVMCFAHIACFWLGIFVGLVMMHIMTR
jgi:hypothetical protein